LVAHLDSLTEFPELFGTVMKLVRLFDNETELVGNEMVMELVALLDSLTEFPELFDGIVMKLVGLFDNETGSNHHPATELQCAYPLPF